MQNYILKKVLFSFLILSIFFLSVEITAQVTIGSDKAPEKFSVLELTGSSGGLRLPMLTTDNRDNMGINQLSGTNAHGLTIFNTDTKCFEFWNSTKWISLCSGQEPGVVSFSDCNSIEVVGGYDMDKAISAQTIKINVPVIVKELGTYQYTAECKGINFIGLGTFVNLGPTTVTLYLDQSSSSDASLSTGIYPVNVTIANRNETPSSIVCNSASIKFMNRSSATLKILNIGGTENNTSLISGDVDNNNSSSNAYAAIGNWLKGSATTVAGATILSPKNYAGTLSVEIINVPYNSAATLQEHLPTASIIWIGASERYSYGYAQFLKEWYNERRGIIMITGDKSEESTIADALGYYIEEGSASIGTTHCSNLPEVFSAATAPFQIGDGLSIAYSGSACGYISTQTGGVPIMLVNNRYTSAIADIDNGVFIFGDKFGDIGASTANGTNYVKVLADIFAWALKNAPIYN